MSKDAKNGEQKSPLETPSLSTIQHKQSLSVKRKELLATKESLQEKLLRKEEEVNVCTNEEKLRVIIQQKESIRKSLPQVGPDIKKRLEGLEELFKQKKLSQEELDARSQEVKKFEAQLKDPELLLSTSVFNKLSNSMRKKLQLVKNSHDFLEQQYPTELKIYKEIKQNIEKLNSEIPASPRRLGNEKSKAIGPATSNPSLKNLPKKDSRTGPSFGK